VLESDAVEPAQSPLWGLGKVIGMEQPGLWGGLVDLPFEADAPALAGELVAVCAGGDAEDQVALRDGRRWVARLVPDARPVPAVLAVHAERSYLITGGLGGIGLAAARRLVERGARHLVLSSRSAPSEAAAAVIEELRAGGCEVRVIAADVSREADVVRLFDEIERSESAPLAGLIHAAGVGTLGALNSEDRDGLDATMAAKVYGGWLLDREVTGRGIELEFFVCTSSIASVWGSVMQAAYAAGNAFLDALCARRVAQGRAASAINFGPWAEVGMGVNEEGLAWLRSRGIRALKPVFYLDALEAVVSGGVSGTTVADVDWATFRSLAEVQRPRPLQARRGIVFGAACAVDRGGAWRGGAGPGSGTR
jgi:NAD(P)-dependent dehydrogenase (short-subunit alcohol dehydrogenase family)